MKISISKVKIKATVMSIKIGIGKLRIGTGGSQSWESYWANQPEVLFFGLYSEISGGQMPNKKTGSSDYLTVAGVAGSETYQCPNTAPYIAADTDYIWFKTDESQRTVTTAELIGYDLQRTPVKYEDNIPNEIVAIIILNAAVTGSKRDRLFKDMWLPILWDNDLNAYGRIKDNRIGQQLWTPEAVATFIDTFTGEDGTLLSAHAPDTANFNWTNAVYVFDILGNKTRYNGTGAFATSYFDSGKADPDVSIDLTIPDENDYLAGLVLRRSGSTTHWRVVIRRSAGATPEIRLYNNTTVITSAEVVHAAGVGTLRAVFTGADIDIYWKGVKVIDGYTTDGSYLSEEVHGIITIKDANYKEVLFDNFTIV